ncbi:MAG: TAT-variant-translocated molybdopterin oxidoreductase [Bacteroidales bacterium]|nr:TAT-variant-translocated molybdopterin oxidoreductase [Bacteroidales bacterium]
MKKYWKSLEELKDIQNGSEVLTEQKPEPEFSIEGLSELEVSNKLKSNRRDFLKFLGFSVGTAALASSCEMPVRKAIPYLNTPDEVTPGMANYYASSFYDGHDYCPVVVKVRDGRPIKIEGNELSPMTKGGTSARVQASVLNLYDSARQQYPLKNGNRADWTTVDTEIKTKLEQIAANEGRIVILASTVISPSILKVFEEFKAQYPTTEVVYYDTVSYDAIRKANKETFGREEIPAYRFDNAEIIVGFNADFLGAWLSPIEFSRQYAKTRELNKNKTTMSKHYQFESFMSLTGSNADIRYSIKPSEEAIVLLNLYNKIAAKSDMPTYKVESSPVDLDGLVDELMHHQSKSLIVSGTNDVYIQAIVNGINFLLANLGNTLNFEHTLQTKKGNDQQVDDLIGSMRRGDVDALFMYNVNPVYEYFNPEAFSEGLTKVGLTVALNEFNDETARLATYLCPDSHYLESWGDAEPYNGMLTLAQPAIRTIFDTRQAPESFLKWAGIDTDFHNYIKIYWESNFFGKQDKYVMFSDFWNHSLQDGVFNTEVPTKECPLYDFEFIEKNASKLLPGKSEGIELVLYEKMGIGTGKMANNPWLQELPDPISKAVWDNYVAMSPQFAKENNLTQEDVVLINGSIELPVLYQPGQPYGTVSIALGYGRENIGKVANGIGKNVYPLAGMRNGSKQYTIGSITIEKTGSTYPIATTQTHHSMEGRPLVRETVLDKWKEKKNAGNELHEINEKKAVTLYKKPEYEGFHWGLGVDLNKCIGCSACVIACQAENNVAVIGKEEVKNRRIMHWMRIDRYYSLTEPEKPGPDTIYRIEPENPAVVHQPVMCQHCDNAPCENVCPVAATPHSKEGLNQMAYNRCIGTRYCMNNCPYRVRRFNWYRFVDNDKFDYNQNGELSKMVLNPDVVVRERGVVEKCSFCVQRIQEKKLEAKKENRQLRDGEIQTACVQACPTKALVFGDMNNSDTEIAQIRQDPRTYNLLEELHTLSSVSYLTLVRNKPADEFGEGMEHGHHG